MPERDRVVSGTVICSCPYVRESNEILAQFFESGRIEIVGCRYYCQENQTCGGRSWDLCKYSRSVPPKRG